MLKNFRERFSDFFLNDEPPLNERSSLRQIAAQFANAAELLERKYGVNLSALEQSLTLSEFAAQFSLPPAPVLLAELQLHSMGIFAEEMPPKEAAALMANDPTLQILDVRELWEQKLGSLPKARSLDTPLLDEILTKWEKDTPILLYCHHGVRSNDAAQFLKDRGFTRVYSLRGGIDAWSTQIDPSIGRYDGQYC